MVARNPITYCVDEKGCHICTSHKKGKRGYPQMWHEGRVQKVHRVVYLTQKGDIPDGLLVRHTCDDTMCINPEHLILGTHQDNTDDMWSRGRGKVPTHSVSPVKKLSPSQVMEILSSDKRQCVIAAEYSVSPETVWGIKKGYRWNAVTKVLKTE
jgi:hypothetical protein